MLAFLSNLGPVEIVVVAIVAILVFGKNLPEAAAKAVIQLRKFRTAVDDLKRDTGIERELRDIERTVREAEWEARKPVGPAALPRTTTHSAAPSVAPAAAPEPTSPSGENSPEDVESPDGEDPPPDDPLEERRRTWRP
jgi:Sec-independent protein translocase protein TatA